MKEVKKSTIWFSLALLVLIVSVGLETYAQATTINFDGYPHYTVVNNLYSSLGVTFTRDDGQDIYINDWAALGRSTTSPTSVLATVLEPGVTTTWATSLNVIFASPTYDIGAYFGNDQYGPDFWAMRLTVFDASDNEIGSITVPTNNNTSVDQFIGLTSTVPFTKATFENLEDSTHSIYAVAIDDLTFTSSSSVPEPTTMLLLGLGLMGVLGIRRKLKK